MDCWKKILLAFIIGSSWPIFIMYFRGFYGHSQAGSFHPRNCISQTLEVDEYYFYTQAAPVYLGTMSAIAVALSEFTRLGLAGSFVLIAIASAVVVSFVITQCQVYSFTSHRLQQQYLRLIVYHSVSYLMVFVLFRLLE